MDFKVAGTADGITAIQLDIKIDGITREDHAPGARPGARRRGCTSSSEMEKALATPRAESLEVRPAHHHDPRSTPTRSATIIGPGGKNIRAHRRGDRLQDRHRGRRHRASSPRPTAGDRSAPSTSSRPSRPSPRSAGSTRAASQGSTTSAPSSRSCPAPTACSTSRSSSNERVRAVEDVVQEGDEINGQGARGRTRREDPALAARGPGRDGEEEGELAAA